MEDKIELFWDWFGSHQNELLNCIKDDVASEKERFVFEIDQHILSMGRFSWDIGPGIEKPWLFTISPNGNVDLLRLSRQIISQAPNLNSWEFSHFRIPTADPDVLEFFDEEYDMLNLNCSNWKVQLHKLGNGKVDLTVEIPSDIQVSQDNLPLLASQALVNHLGEEMRILAFNEISVVRSFNAAEKIEMQTLAKLRDLLG